MSDTPYTLDFNDVEIVPAEIAAEDVSAEDVQALFTELELANKGWHDSQRKTALAALRVVTQFVERRDFNNRALSRPLSLLLEELSVQPEPRPGNILAAANNRQTLEFNRRKTIDALKAACAFAARELAALNGVTLGEQANSIANIMMEFRFPPSDYYHNDGATRPAGHVPGHAAIASRVQEWAVSYERGVNDAAKKYSAFKERKPHQRVVAEGLDTPDQRAKQLIYWLRDEFEAGGFTRY